MLKQFATDYPNVASAIHTFVATFIVSFIGQLSLISADQILSPATWTISAIASIAMVAARAAVKAVSPLA